MTWLDEIAAVNAITRSAVRDLIDRGLANDIPAEDIAKSLVALDVFDESSVEFGKADLPALPDPREALIRSLFEPPVINIEPPVVHVAAPIVNMPPVEVYVSAPNVTVESAKADLPIVIPAPVVHVTTPSEMSITSLPGRLTKRRVKRDQNQLIVETQEVETDA
jgi:hypothetical protein